MNFYKVICNDNINYKFNLSLEAAKTIFNQNFELWNVTPNSGFNLILSQTSIYFCILSILNKICAFHELIEIEDCYFGYESRSHIHSILLFILFTIFLPDLLYIYFTQFLSCTYVNITVYDS